MTSRETQEYRLVYDKISHVVSSLDKFLTTTSVSGQYSKPITTMIYFEINLKNN